MGRSENQKLKLLYLKQHLERATDEAHPTSTAELIAMLEQHGISAERKSIYSDLDALEEYGLDLIRSGGEYWLAERTFSLPELKLLVDAVQASRFITVRKSRELIAKLQTLCSEHEAQGLHRSVTVLGRAKTMNEEIYYNVDALQNAITDNRRIRFRYFDLALDGSKRFREGDYLADPCALCWEDELYYLIAETEKHGITHFRVDKMANIAVLDEPRHLSEAAKGLDLADYSRRTFGMFSGEVCQVQLRFENSLSGVVRDRFGQDVMLIPDGADRFTLLADVAVSPLFFSWVMMFGARAEILSPERVRQDYLALLEQSRSVYEA